MWKSDGNNWFLAPDSRKPAERYVWHHTGAQGLIGIVRGASLWASSPLSLNDSQELLYGESVIREVWRRVRDATDVDAQRLVDEVLDTDLVAEVASRVFILSTTLEADSLNQWQRYNQGSDRGYAVVLDTAQPLAPLIPARSQEQIMSSFTLPGWWRVLYEPDPQISAVEEHLRDITTRAEPKREWAVPNGRTWLATLMCRLKHRGFRAEKEMRYIATRAYPIKEAFRAGPAGIVPCIALAGATSTDDIWGTSNPTMQLPIAGICCGPGSGTTDIVSAERLLRAGGYDVASTGTGAPDQVGLFRSDVPYRPS